MNRITGIEITNLLAFHGKHHITLPKGGSLLIYGENGSGKTSLFRALNTFLDAGSFPDGMRTYRNRWALPADEASNVVVSFEGRESLVNFAHVPNENWINDIYLSSGYLSYREMLRTHFDLEEDPNYFDLVINHILKGYKTTRGNVLNKDWENIESACKDFLQKVQKGGDWASPGSIVPTEDAEMSADEDIDDGTTTVADLKANRLQEIDDLVSEFNNTLLSFLEMLNPKMEEFLKEFDNKVTIALTLRQAQDINGADIFTNNSEPYFGAKFEFREGDTEIEKMLILPFITTEVTLFNQSFPEHQQYLNEARLSALAICIFLGAIHAKPNQNETKILLLDDVLIGLDTGNRLPLLKLLKNHFEDYQVLLTTYDKNWFEIARIHLSYESVEMYYEPVKQVRQPDGAFQELPSGDEFPDSVTDSDKRYFERPLIMDASDNVQRAKKYFKAMDFPAAGNALRKECERILKRYLPPTRRIAKDGSEITTLEALIIQLKTFFEDCDLPLSPDLESEIHYFKRAVLNPSSHDDLKSPLYRKEIERLFAFVIELKKLPTVRREVVLKAHQELVYENPTLNYRARIVVGDNVYKATSGNKVTISKCPYYMDWWEWNGVEYAKNDRGEAYSENEIKEKTADSKKPEDIVNGIKRFLRLTSAPDFMKEFKTNNKTLEELFSLPVPESGVPALPIQNSNQ